jgi:hypothetical protein
LRTVAAQVASRLTMRLMSQRFLPDGSERILRIDVPCSGGTVTALISNVTCQSHSQWHDETQTLDDFYRHHRNEIDGIVARKARDDARRPVVVMARDF